MRHRIAALEGFPRVTDGDAAARTEAGQQLCNELSLRSVYWGQVIYAPPRSSGPIVSASDSVLTRFTTLLALCAIVVLFLVILSLSLTLGKRGYVGVIVGVIVVGVVSRAIGGRSRLKGICEALRDRRCPDCSYALNDLEPGIDPQLLGGMWVGPRACPECGAAWPFIPPPVPESHRAHAEELLKRWVERESVNRGG